MTRRTWQFGGLAALLALFGFPQPDAKAYCVVAGDSIAFWSVKLPDLRIPVWLSLSMEHSVANTGQTPQDVARLAIEVIARHNESVRTPKLYFAGFTNKGFDEDLVNNGDPFPWGELPVGITVMSFTTCKDKDDYCGDGMLGCGTARTRNYGDASIHNDPLGWVFLGPASGCVPYSMTGYVDMAQLLLHELGHALGLQHSNRRC